jgi:HTH-type transcriptional regulator / antitoxin HipB
MSPMKDMPLKTPERLGAAIRLRRKERGLSQVELAERLGVERKWIIKLEAGNPKAEFGLILKALAELRLESKLIVLDTGRSEESRASQRNLSRQGTTSRLDQVFQRLDRRGK